MGVTQRGRSLVRIAEIVLAAPAANLDFQAIPADFRHLYLVGSVRSDVNAASDSVNLNLNNDTTNANYDRQHVQGAAAATTSQESLAAAAARSIGVCPGNTSPANHFAGLEIIVYDYKAAKFKVSHISSTAWTARTTGTLIVRDVMQGWASTAIVNRLTVLPTTGTNFAAGSAAVLYGMAGLV